MMPTKNHGHSLARLLSEMPTSIILPTNHYFRPSLSPVVSLSLGILHERTRMQMLAKSSSNLLQRSGGNHRGGRAQPGWRTFMMTCLHWILGYTTRLEIWCKIGLSGDWCHCTVLHTRSGARYYWTRHNQIQQQAGQRMPLPRTHICMHAQQNGQVKNILPPVAHRTGAEGIKMNNNEHTCPNHFHWTEETEPNPTKPDQQTQRHKINTVNETQVCLPANKKVWNVIELWEIITTARFSKWSQIALVTIITGASGLYALVLQGSALQKAALQ